MKKYFIPAALTFFRLLCITCAFAQDIDPPVMGWSSWNTYRVNIKDELIRRQADAAVRLGLRDAGYIYINIDDGFFGGRDSEGNLVTHPERFPDGLEGTVDYIHARGMKAGIYSDAGCNTCGSMWDNDALGVGVGFYGHEKQDADMYFNRWGFDFIKIDYCGAGQHLNLEEQERYSTICTAIREVCDRDISINICRWAFPGTEGLEHRIGGLEKDKLKGSVSHDPANHQFMVNARAEKVARVVNCIPDQTVIGPDQADLLVIGWGGTRGNLQTAVEDLQAEGKSIALCHFNYINPLPRNVRDILGRYRNLVVCELNGGQFAGYLRQNFQEFTFEQYNKCEGLPFTVVELKNKFNEILNR